MSFKYKNSYHQSEYIPQQKNVQEAKQQRPPGVPGVQGWWDPKISWETDVSLQRTSTEQNASWWDDKRFL